MRFGDREFYLDWWNARSIDEYWRLWNCPVHNWFKRHVYRPLRNGQRKKVSIVKRADDKNRENGEDDKNRENAENDKDGEKKPLLESQSNGLTECTVTAPSTATASSEASLGSQESLIRSSSTALIKSRQFQAQLLVFFISAVLHEYIIAVPTHIYQGWAFMAMFMQVPFILLTSAIQKRFPDSSFGNYLFWFVFCIVGQPMCLIVYYKAYVTRNVGAGVPIGLVEQ